jgi:two-component sensor histidine kinase
MLNSLEPTVPCGEQIASSIALTINELATNSAKYGALSLGGERVCVAWQTYDDAFRLTWRLAALRWKSRLRKKSRRDDNRSATQGQRGLRVAS